MYLPPARPPACPRLQVQFLSHALGGPHQWHGPDMRAAHMRLIRERGLNTSHFDVVAELLVASLQQLGVGQALIAEVVGVVAPLRSAFEPEPEPQQQQQQQQAVAASSAVGSGSGSRPASGAAAASAPPPAPAADPSSLFARLGGEGALCAAVDVFYGKVLADSRIAHFFQGVDMGAQRRKQVGLGAE
jgi:truncated hemoglobin YjbI